MKAKIVGVVAAILMAFAPLSSFAANLPAAFKGSSTLQAEAVVRSIDQAKHTLTVRDAQGGEGSFTIADPRSLAQIRQGSTVRLRMTRNAVIRVVNPAGAQGNSAATAPHDTVQNVSAAVTAVDHANGVLELKRADGSAFHIQSRESAALANVTPGMQVSITFAPGVSVAVSPAQ